MKTKAGAILSSIRIDRSLDRKISVQLYMGLRDIILSGGLKGGERLPASRTLTSEVGVSRMTVIDAIGRLVSEGLLESRIGAGTFVSRTMIDRVRVQPEAASDHTGRAPRLSPSTVRAVELFAEHRRLPHKSQAFVIGYGATSSRDIKQGMTTLTAARTMMGSRSSMTDCSAAVATIQTDQRRKLAPWSAPGRFRMEI